MIQLINKYKWLLMASLFSVITVVSVKYHLLYPDYFLLLVTILSEIGLIYSYIQLLKMENVLIGFSSVKILSIIIVSISSLLFLDVKLTNRKMFGILFSFLALYLLGT